MKQQTYLVLAIGLVLAFVSQAVTANTLPFSLKSINASAAKTLDYNSSVATIAMVYQPDCPWCKKQGKWLAKVQQECAQHLNLALIGNKGSKQTLKRELKHFDKSLPAYLADKPFLRSVGGIAASPTTLFFDKHGKLLAKRRGYIEPEQFLHAVDMISNNNCKVSPVI